MGVKWPGREDDCSPLPNAKVRNAWSYTSTPQTMSSWHGAWLHIENVFMAQYL